jgi:N-acetyl-gamma-glutamyl-phosphate reductase
MTRVAVVGATGYAGAELVRILCNHPGVQLTMVTSRQYAGVAFDDRVRQPGMRRIGRG